ncbi:MAG TPA: type II toxin-antitoxin system RelE/ParE family toxin, partial [Paracoccaceae bacterium]|nr:type II toxin-antitoxin system RelE/ParE family toxin [Paracoccaceae bacterium]
MTLEVAYSRRALGSLQRIDEYLIERNPAGARKVRREIERTIGLLAGYPGIGALTRSEGVRFHVTRRYRYRIVYRATARY